jgi:glycosyltransferase involved in cell wall biosynthesis
MSDIKISVFTICYNQENYISDAIESIVNQSIQPFEYIICDDCSNDKTWEIVKKYQLKYPHLIKSFRNEKNLGLYANANFAQSLVTGNLITSVSGDDLILPNYFQDVINFISENNIDPENDSFMVISNIVNLYTNGAKTYYSNYCLKDKNLFAFRLRYILDDRFGFVSKPSFIETGGFQTNIGLHADYLWGFNRILKTKNFYFLNNYYHVYRVGVGIASKTKIIESNESFLKTLEIVKLKYLKFFNKKDLVYFKYIVAKCNFIINNSLKNYFLLFYHTFRNIGNFGNNKKQIKAFIFIFIPNCIKKPILFFNFFRILSK